MVLICFKLMTNNKSDLDTNVIEMDHKMNEI